MASVQISTVTAAYPWGNNQRALCRAGSRIYALYYNGTNLVYTYSDDNGGTWAGATTVKSGGRIGNAVYDSVNGRMEFIYAGGGASNIGLEKAAITTNVTSGVPGALNGPTIIDAGGTNAGVEWCHAWIASTGSNPRLWVVGRKYTSATNSEVRVWYAGVGTTSDTAGNWLQPTGGSILNSTVRKYAMGVYWTVSGADKCTILVQDKNTNDYRAYTFDPTAATPNVGTATTGVGATFTDSDYSTITPMFHVCAKADFLLFGRLDEADNKWDLYRTVNGTSWTTDTNNLTAGRLQMSYDGTNFRIIHADTFEAAATNDDPMSIRLYTISTTTLGSAAVFSDGNGENIALPFDTGSTNVYCVYRRGTASAYSVRVDYVVQVVYKAITPGGVAATSTVSGGIIRAKVLAPSSIAATSTVSGSVQAKKFVTPASVVATSTVSGSIKALRRIYPASVAATSSVSGNVIAKKFVTPAAVSATSSVTGAITKLRPIVPASVAATSSVAGSVVALKFIRPATVAATSTVSANVTALKLIKPAAVAATSAISGSVIALKRIVTGAVSATSTVSATVKKLANIAGTVASTSTVSGSIQALRRLAAAAVSASSTVTATVVARRAIRPATVAATSTVTGTVAKLAKISGAVSATSSVSGSVVALRRLFPGSVSATSTVSATIVARRAILPGAVSATSTVSASVIARRRILPSAVLATSTVGTSVIALRKLTASGVSATSTVAGSVISLRAIRPSSVLATSSVSGSVTARRPIFPSTVQAISTVTAAVVVIRGISGAVLATSTVSGSIHMIRGIQPVSVLATSTVSGSFVSTPASILVGMQVHATSTVSGTIKIMLIFENTLPDTAYSPSPMRGDLASSTRGEEVGTGRATASGVEAVPGTLGGGATVGGIRRGP